MQKTKRHILSTRPLTEEVVAKAAQQNIIIDEISFIETAPLADKTLSEKIKLLAAKNITAVFTSMNAVTAVADIVQHKVDWKVYSIGSTTTQLVQQKITDNIIDTAPDAATLATAIIKNGEKEIYFFCGNIRRNELPNALKNAGISVNEFVVYHTTETPKAVNKPYDAILFYSPSAVESFFSVNKAAPATLHFAIGSTTAAALKKYSQQIIVAKHTGKQQMAEEMIAYFNTQKN